MNKAILIGRVGSDPELKTFSNGGTICTLSLATSEKYTDKNGEKQEVTEWHTVKFNGKLAEVAHKWVKKGHKLSVLGKIHYREVEKDGVKRYFTDILASEMELLTPLAKSSTENASGAQSNEEETDPPF